MFGLSVEGSPGEHSSVQGGLKGLLLPSKFDSYMKWAARLTVLERVDRAEAIVRDMSFAADDLSATASQAKVALLETEYDARLFPNKSIESFNYLRFILRDYLFVRTMALWDVPRDDRASLPNAVCLLANESVLGEIGLRTFDQHADRKRLPPLSEVERFYLDINKICAEDSEFCFAFDRMVKAIGTLRALVYRLGPCFALQPVALLRLYRDKNIAHTLSGYEGTIVEFGKLKDVFKLSNIGIISTQRMYLYVNRTDFHIWTTQRSRHKKSAMALWTHMPGCSS